MFANLLSGYIGANSQEIKRLLALSREDLIVDPVYTTWVNALDHARLETTLGLARDNYAAHMPEYHDQLEQHYGIDNAKMSAFTLGNWLLGYLHYPEMIADLPGFHHRLPREAVVEMLPAMLEKLSEIPEGAADWQRALAVLALPLAAQ